MMETLNQQHGVTRRIARWHRGRNSIGELRSLDDHQLADIGLDRIRLNALVGNVVRAGGFPV